MRSCSRVAAALAAAWLGMLATAGITAAPAAGPALRHVAVAASPNLSRAEAEAGGLHSVLRGALLEALAPRGDLRLVDPARVDALCGQFGTSANDVDGEFLFRHLASALPLDALVFVEPAGATQALVSVITVAGASARKPCLAAAQPAACAAAIREVLGGLGMPAPGGPMAFADSPQLFRSHHLALNNPPYLDLSGESLARLAAMPGGADAAAIAAGQAAPAWEAKKDSALLSARLLWSAAAVLATARPDSGTELHNGLGEALRCVLGSPQEPAAYPLLRTTAGGRFEPLLQELAAPLLPGKQDMAVSDALLDEALEKGETLPGMPGPDDRVAKSAPVAPAARLGAIRALGCLSSAVAEKALVRAAASPDAGVRLAAAAGLGERQGESSLSALRTLAADKDPGVRLRAMLGLHRRGTDSPSLPAALRAAPDSYFLDVPDACSAFASLAGAGDLDRIRSLSEALRGRPRRDMIRAQLRLGGVDPDAILRMLRDEDPGVIGDALRRLTAEAASPAMRAALRGLANDPDDAVAEAARAALAAYYSAHPEAPDAALWRLDCGSLYERLSALTGAEGRRELVPSADLLERGSTNFQPLVRFESLRLMGERYPERVLPLVRAGLADPSRWVRIQAAAMAARRPMPELSGALSEALARERSEAIRPALAAAAALAAGKALPPMRPAAVAQGDDNRCVWGNIVVQKDNDTAPLGGFLCYYYPPFKAARDAGKVMFVRTLWGAIPAPESLLQSPRVFDYVWSEFDERIPQSELDEIDGFDLRILGLGQSWPACWRDFCRDAAIDPARVGGALTNLTVYERRAFDAWTLGRAVSGWNLLCDIIKLKHAFARPGIQISTWVTSQFQGEVFAPLDRMRFDLSWGMPIGDSDELLRYTRARMCQTIWPGRPYVYDTPNPGGIPDGSVRYRSPMPEAFVLRSTNDVYGHALLAWMAGAHVKIAPSWRFLDYKTVPQGLYTPSVNLPFNALGPDPAALDAAVAHTLRDAPLEGPKEAAGVADALKAGDRDIELDLRDAKDDPTEQLRRKLRIGMRLMQKYLYDCARVFASLPHADPKPDALLVCPGLLPPSARSAQGGPPAIAARELIGPFDFLPGINLLPGRDLGRYRIIVVHNATLLRDETIQVLSAWLKDTPGLLIVHQELSADNAAEASTPADHDGVLRSDWPWEKDLAVHPAGPGEGVRLTRLELATDAGSMKVSADTNMSYAACLTAKAAAKAKVGDKAILARWRDPEYRGAVLFDGLRAPSREYVELLAGEINALAKEGIGRPVTGRPVMLEAETEQFQVAVSLGHGEAVQKTLRLSGIDLMSGAVDPVVGPGAMGAAIVPRRDYFHRYLACTPRIVALGDREFSKAGKAEGGGLLLQNAGIIQLAGRSPLKVSRQNGQPLPAIPFDYDWVFDGAKEGTAVYKTDAGVQLTFVRCSAPVTVAEIP